MKHILTAALLGMSVLLFASACGAVDAARDAGEKVRGSGSPEDEPPGESQNDAGAQEGESEEQAQATGKGSNASELVLEPKWYKDSDGNVVPDLYRDRGRRWRGQRRPAQG